MPYHVSKEAQRLLLHAGTHALLRGHQDSGLVTDLPPLNRILLQVNHTRPVRDLLVLGILNKMALSESISPSVVAFSSPMFWAVARLA
jgi:hypothetical protein